MITYTVAVSLWLAILGPVSACKARIVSATSRGHSPSLTVTFAGDAAALACVERVITEAARKGIAS